MKAVILAAGKGTRMRGLTQEIPKPMLRVQGKPILEHILLGLRDTGIRDIFIVTGFRAESIEEFFGDGRDWGVSLAYGRQTVQDGTGKAPEPARSFVGADPFLLTYGDILVHPATYQAMVRRFQEAGFSGLLTVIRGVDVTKGAVVVMDSAFCLSQLIEKPGAEQLAELRQQDYLRAGDPVWNNAGIYIFQPVVFDYTARLRKSPRGEYELTDAIIAMQIDGLQIAGLEIPGRWVDVRDPEVLAALENESLS